MDLGFGIGTDRRIFETYLNRCNMGLNPPEHARLGLRCGSLVLGWHRPGAALWASLQGAEISVQSGRCGHCWEIWLCGSFVCASRNTHMSHVCLCAFSCPLSSSMMMLQVIPEPKHRIQRSWNPQSQTSSQPRHERTPRVYIRNQSCIFITQTLKLRRSLFMSFLPDKETPSHALPVASDVCFASTDRCTWQMLSCGYNIEKASFKIFKPTLQNPSQSWNLLCLQERRYSCYIMLHPFMEFVLRYLGISRGGFCLLAFPPEHTGTLEHQLLFVKHESWTIDLWFASQTAPD